MGDEKKRDLYAAYSEAGYKIKVYDSPVMQTAGNDLKTAARKKDSPTMEATKARIKEVSSEIRTLRQEVKLCDDIEARSTLMEQNLAQLQQEQEIERKEEEQHELFQRSGRSGSPTELERR